jgi:hypothetical protein
VVGIRKIQDTPAPPAAKPVGPAPAPAELDAIAPQIIDTVARAAGFRAIDPPAEVIGDGVAGTARGETKGTALDKATRLYSNTLFGAPGPAVAQQKVRDLISTPGFDQISPKSRKRLLEHQAKHPYSSQLADRFRAIGENGRLSTFPEPARSVVIDRLVRYSGNQTRIDNLTNMVRATDFVTAGATRNMVQAYTNRPDDKQLVADFTRVSDRADFRALREHQQEEVLDVLRSSPGGDVNADNTLNLLIEPAFQNVFGEARNVVLNELYKGYRDLRLDPTNMSNLMEVAAAPGFAKLEPDVQKKMIEVLTYRPDSPALATALRDLANDPVFRSRPRDAWNAMLVAYNSVP